MSTRHSLLVWLALLPAAASWGGAPGTSSNVGNVGNAGPPGNADNAGTSGASGAEHYLGIAYGESDGIERYKEEHWVWRDAGREFRQVLYRCPDGRPFARKIVQGRIDDPAPDFAMADQRDGYREGVETRNGVRYMYTVTQQGTPPQRQPLPQASHPVIDAGFDAWLRTHWAASGATLDFLVPSRLSFMPLNLRVQPTTDAAVRTWRLKLDTWYGFAAPTLQVTYEVDGRRLRRFVGPGNVRNADGSTQSVRIEFPPRQRLSAPTKAQIDAAAAAPLPPLHISCIHPAS